MAVQAEKRSGSKPRIDEITILRALAFCVIVLQHSIGEYIYRPDILPQDAVMLGMLYHFTRYGTLTFVLVSTIILFYNYNSKVAYGPFLLKRAKAVLLPFALWTLIYSVYLLKTELLTAAGWSKLLRQFIDPTFGYHMWFILMIFQLYLIFPWLARGVEYLQAKAKQRYGDDLRKPVMILLIVMGAAYMLLMDWSYRIAPQWAQGAGALGQELLGHRTMFVGMYFFYIVLGIVCSLYLKEWRHSVKKMAGWAAIVFIIGYIYAGYRLLAGGITPMNLNLSTYFKPSIFVIILSQIIVLYAAALYILDKHGWAARALKQIGTYSFGGYLVHALVLSWVASWTRGLALEGYHLVATAATFAVVFSVSLFIAWGLDKLPFGVWFTGPMGRRKTTSRTVVTAASDRESTASV